MNQGAHPTPTPMRKTILEIIQAENVLLQECSTTDASEACFLKHTYPTTNEAILAKMRTREIFVRSSGLSFGIGTFIIPQRFHFVKIARKRKKKPKYPESDKNRYAITPRHAKISIIEVNLTVKVNPMMIPIIHKI